MATATLFAVIRVQVRVYGLVQGVGFRPFVYQIAVRAGLSGFVTNDLSGVCIELEGSPSQIDLVVAQLRTNPPPLAHVDRVIVREILPEGRSDFTVLESRHGDSGQTYVAPDTAVCSNCISELFDPEDRRYRYPFITCTNCGPRFTITRALPYDRATTTMAPFQLCSWCAAQYQDPHDRRFHAQPLACPECGPQIWLEHANVRVDKTDRVVSQTQSLISNGSIVAIKGIGGFHFVCDATNDEAVTELRNRKHRPAKPFAVMVPDLEAVGHLAYMGLEEGELLASPARPIVLLRAKEGTPTSNMVAPDNPLLGVMLPYAPMHHLLFRPIPGGPARVPDILVMTSGNLSDEPLCFKNHDARQRLGSIADGFVMHDREIHVPVDDSVFKVSNGKPVPIRRSRGYTPIPIHLPLEAPPLLAVGGELKNTFCMVSGTDGWLSQHIGDMGSVETIRAFEKSTEQFVALYDVHPATLATDMHPGYHTTAWAEKSQVDQVRTVQHHHAHFAALLCEHGEPSSAPALGVVFDGTGFGVDGTIWGGEFLLGGYGEVERIGHLLPVLLPGGDATSRRPYRSALAHLRSAGAEWHRDLPPVEAAGKAELVQLDQDLSTGRNCVLSSSMGRLFDAIAALIGLNQVSSYEAEAAMKLEELAAVHLADEGSMERRGNRTYRMECAQNGVIDPAPMIRAIVADVRAGEAPSAISAGAHDAIADAIGQVAERVRRENNVDTVGLTGGVFQNAVLATMATGLLEARGFRVLTHRLVPPNDGGIALGQAVVAAAQLRTEGTH